MSPLNIQADVRDLRHVQRRAQRMKKAQSGATTVKSFACTCTEQTEITRLRFSNFVRLSNRRSHRPECVFAAFQNICTRIELRLSMCAFRLSRKLNFTMDIYRGAGIFSIVPALRYVSIVRRLKSPAFCLLAEFNDHKTEQEAGEEFCGRFLELFQRRDDTPYIQTEWGETLLHVIHILEARSANRPLINHRISAFTGLCMTTQRNHQRNSWQTTT
jgi:hypothetical protein